MGVYSTAQFFGIFLGGVVGGWLQIFTPENSSIVFITVFSLAWILVMLRIQTAPRISHTSLLWVLENPEPSMIKQAAATLLNVEGVIDAAYDVNSMNWYLKVDKTKFDMQFCQSQLNALSKP